MRIKTSAEARRLAEEADADAEKAEQLGRKRLAKRNRTQAERFRAIAATLEAEGK